MYVYVCTRACECVHVCAHAQRSEVKCRYHRQQFSTYFVRQALSCMCVGYAHKYVGVRVHVHECGGQSMALIAFSYHSLTYCFVEFHTELELEFLNFS